MPDEFIGHSSELNSRELVAWIAFVANHSIPAARNAFLFNLPVEKQAEIAHALLESTLVEFLEIVAVATGYTGPRHFQAMILNDDQVRRMRERRRD